MQVIAARPDTYRSSSQAASRVRAASIAASSALVRNPASASCPAWSIRSLTISMIGPGLVVTFPMRSPVTAR